MTPVCQLSRNPPIEFRHNFERFFPNKSWDSVLHAKMVQVLIKMPSKESCPNWAMIDLQGDLETRQPVPLQGKFIGDLHFTKQDQPILIIGHHILYGKVVHLEKPFAILTKHQQQNEYEEGAAEEAMEVDQKCNSTSYTIKAIIKTKLLFKTRPKPIIAHVPKKL